MDEEIQNARIRFSRISEKMKRSVRVEAVLSLGGYSVTTPPPALVDYSSSLSLSTTKDRPNMPSIN